MLPIVTLVLVLLFGIFMIVQSASLSKMIDTLGHQVDSNLSSIGQLKRSNDSVNEQIAEIKEQLDAEPTVPEATEPTLSEMDVSFRVISSETGSDISGNLQNQGTLDYQTGTDQKAVK